MDGVISQILPSGIIGNIYRNSLAVIIEKSTTIFRKMKNIPCPSSFKSPFNIAFNFIRPVLQCPQLLSSSWKLLKLKKFQLYIVRHHRKAPLTTSTTIWIGDGDLLWIAMLSSFTCEKCNRRWKQELFSYFHLLKSHSVLMTITVHIPQRRRCSSCGDRINSLITLFLLNGKNFPNKYNFRLRILQFCCCIATEVK